MGKKILIISTSSRKGGNSDVLEEEFKKCATYLGHEVKKIYLHDKEIGFCKGCFVYQNT